MSIELFSLKLGLASQVILEDFKRNGYVYDAQRHMVEMEYKRPYSRAH